MQIIASAQCKNDVSQFTKHSRLPWKLEKSVTVHYFFPGLYLILTLHVLALDLGTQLSGGRKEGTFQEMYFHFQTVLMLDTL